MEDPSPRLQCLVRREDHRSVTTMTLIDHVKEHVGGVGTVGEVAHFIDDQDGRMRVRLQRLGELARAKGRREVVDEGSGGGEELSLIHI